MVIRVLGATLALALVLSGCTSKEKAPTVLPPVTSASPSLAQLSPPPEAAAETAEGASAFARYYMSVISQAFASADPDTLRAVSAAGCEGCKLLIASVEDLKEREQRRVGGEYVVKAAVAPAVEKGDVVVDVRYERAAAQLVDKQGTVVMSSPPVPATDAQIRLVWRDSTWVVQGYRIVKA